MAIPGQQNINIGNVNSPANSDSLYTAFRTVQNNFTTLFNSSSPINTISPGTGITVRPLDNGVQILNSGVTSLIAGNNVTITTRQGSIGTTGDLIISATGGGGNGGGGSGTVTSVGITSTSNTLSITNSPITQFGNINVDLPIQTNITAGSYRNPNITVDNRGRVTLISNGVSSGVTSVAVNGGSGISVTGSPITSSGTITVTNTGVTSIVAGTGIVINQSNGAVTISSTGGGGGGTGTVTRVGVVSNTLSVSGSPIISSGNIGIELPSNISVNVITANTGNIRTINTTDIQAQADANTPITSSVYSVVPFSHITTRQARGNIVAPNAVANGDQLMNISSQGYTGFNQFQDGGEISVVANGTPANSSSLIPSDVILRAVSTSNTYNTLRLSQDGNLTTTGSYINRITGNSQPFTQITARSRGTTITPLPVIVGDAVVRNITYAYTGNGTASIDGVSGYTVASLFETIVAGLPATPGAFIPSNVSIRTVSTSNALNSFTFTSTGNLIIPGTYVGNGSGLSNLTGANVTGQVPFAAVANSVAGANVTGQVPFAAVANSVAGANVSGQVPFAAVANSVSLANVSGFDGNVANLLTGGKTFTAIPTRATLNIGNVANINLNGSATQVLSGAGTWITVGSGNGSVTQVGGNGGGLGFTLSGTVTTTGNLTLAAPDATSLRTTLGIGNVANSNLSGVSTELFNGTGGWTSAGSLTVASAGTAGTAGTVTTAAQPNITSVGTLTALGVSNTITAVGFTANTGVFTGNANGLTNIPAANLVGDVNNNISVTVSANANNTIGNLVSLTINGVTYQLLAK